MEEKKELIKPQFEGDVNAKVVAIGKIEDNIEEVKDYAIRLKGYYEKIIFTPETMKSATDEKAQVNKFKDKISDYRKKIIEEYNKPIKNFETTAKEAEKLLKETYESINNQTTAYNNKLKDDIKEKLKMFFEEYSYSKGVEKYIAFDDLNINVTLAYVTESGSLTKKAKDEVVNKVDAVSKEIETIKTMESADEILVEYLKLKDLSLAITEVNQRHAKLEKIQKENEEIKEQKITDEEIIKKIDSITAPKVEEVQEKIYEVAFKVRATKTKLSELKGFLNDGGYDYE